MLKAVIYARYSSDKQNEQSIEGQITYCTKYAKEHDMTIVDQYIDRAMTGTNDHRPAFQNMIKDSHTKAWDVILVYKLDRFSRNKYESAANKNILNKNGKKLISVTEYIPDSPEGIILESMLEGMAQYYSAELSQKVKRGNHESRMKGIFTTGHPPFGYDLVNKHLVINEDEAISVRAVYKLFSEGYSYKDIANILNEQEEFNPSHKKFYAKLVENIFINKNYTGIHECNGYVYDKIYPCIIDKETWENAHKDRPKKTKHFERANIRDYSDSPYLLMPKVFCGTCKCRMRSTSGTSHTGKILMYYACSCQNKKETGCKTKYIRKELLEDVVFRTLKNILKKESIVNKMAEKLYEKHQTLAYDNPKIYALIENKENIENTVASLSNIVINNPNAKLATQIEKLRKQLEEINLKIDRLKNKELDDITLEEIKAYLSYILGDKIVDDETFRRKLAKHFIKYVIIYPSKIIVGLRGYSPNLHDYELEPDFENIDKCLISQDRRRSSNKENVGSPKSRYLRTQICDCKYLFSCSEILILRVRQKITLFNKTQ
ncbi:MAG: recombinase family protein [Clostridiales bacterium]|nr:recombinase family protein [Clostridiales bacterium]